MAAACSPNSQPSSSATPTPTPTLTTATAATSTSPSRPRSVAVSRASRPPTPNYLGRKPSKLVDTAVVGAAGDIACPSLNPRDWSDEERQSGSYACKYPETASLLATLRPDAVLPLGDTQYPSGALPTYRSSYDPTWGRFKAITYPVVGNHEYGTPNAEGFYTYFGNLLGDADTGYYSYDLGSWHVVALNSQCEQIGGCQTGSAEQRWLKADLAAHPAKCTLAYWHEPRFSSGIHGSNTDFTDFWSTLTAAGADVVLSGHDHEYERFEPLDADGKPDAKHGMTEFVVGTGGDSLGQFHGLERGSVAQIPRPDPTNPRRYLTPAHYGIIALTLGPNSFSWKFNPIEKMKPLDSGTTRCH